MHTWLNKAHRFIAAIVLVAAVAQAQPAPDNPDNAKPINQIGSSEILGYLDQLVDWQRTAMAIDPAINNAREQIYHDSMQQNAVKLLQSGFDFSRAEAALLHPDTDDDEADTQDANNAATASPQQRLAHRAHEVDQQITNLTAQRSAVRAKPGQSVAAQQQAIDDQLKLANAHKELLEAVLANMTVAGDNTPKGLANKINDLERSIPELNSEPARLAAKPAATAAAPIPSPIPMPSASVPADTNNADAARPSSSIIGLSTAAFDILRKQRELKSFLAQTMQLETATQNLMKPLRASLDNTTNAQNNQPLTIDQRVAAYKQVGAAIVPLGRTMVWIDVSKRTLKNWQQILDTQLRTTLRQLAIRLAVLAVAISIPLMLSRMAHRAIRRYVSDGKRQYQLNTARRIVTGLVILFILLGTFISDFSSFATFAGFITAGLALALQSVLLSLVAHFFFYGRFGVRAGDRVNVAGVTGEIVQIGMVRFYMRELKEGDKGFEPTGKVVAFPNSILFQNTAFYKYV